MIYEKTLHFFMHIAKPITTRLPLRLARVMQDGLRIPILEKFKAKPYYFKNSEDTESFFAYPQSGHVSDTVFLYVHGGAYTTGGQPYVRGIAGALACKLNTCVMGCVYRLAPEFPYPCSLEDTYQCYEKLLEQGKKIALIGESAGGGLIFSLCAQIKEKGLPMPCAVVAFSPWTDLTMSGESMVTNKRKDPSLSEKQLRKAADSYTVNTDSRNPLVSPVFLNTEGFPPTLLYVGSDEILLSDTLNMHKNLLSSGVKSELHIGEKMWHAYPLFDTYYDKEIFTRIKEFVADDQ